MKNWFYLFFAISFLIKHYFNYYADGSKIESIIYAYADDFRNLIFSIIAIYFSLQRKDKIFKFISISAFVFYSTQTLYTYIALHTNWYSTSTSTKFVFINYFIILTISIRLVWSTYKNSFGSK